MVRRFFSFLAARCNVFAKRREQIFALRYLPSLLKLVWQTNARYATTMVLLRILRCCFPIAILLTGKLIVDALVVRIQTGNPVRIWPLVFLEFSLVITSEIFSRLSALAESLLGDLVSNKISVRLMEHASSLDLAHFENPSFYDRLERARHERSAVRAS